MAHNYTVTMYRPGATITKTFTDQSAKVAWIALRRSEGWKLRGE